jgi:hypothetical protein
MVAVVVVVGVSCLSGRRYLPLPTNWPTHLVLCVRYSLLASPFIFYALSIGEFITRCDRAKRKRQNWNDVLLKPPFRRECCQSSTAVNMAEFAVSRLGVAGLA